MPLLRGRGVFAVLAAAVLVCVTTLPADAQEEADGDAPSLDVSVSFQETEATIGDRVRVKVEVGHGPEIVVTAVRPDLPGAEVLGGGQTTIQSLPDGSQVTTTTFLYQLFTLGRVETGPVEVRWLQEDGTGGTVESPGASLLVASVRSAGDEALRPLKPPLAIAGGPPAWLLPVTVGGVVLAVAVLVAVVVRWWRRRRRTVEPEAEPMDLPERAAREALASVQGAALPEEAEFQRFYGTIASVVRQYLSDRFGFNATALTSTELESRMTSYGVDRWQARLVSGLLERCDRAVYAREYPDPASADHDLTVAYEIVELSRPQPVAELEAVAS